MIPRLAALCCLLVLAAPAAAQPLPPARLLAAAPQPGGTRVFCDQSVTFALAPRARVPASYRRFLGVWSDAAWGPNSCAALVVKNIDRAGMAQILYIYGPLSASDRPGPGGVLRGTGIIRDGTLRFQDSDGTQFVFRPDIADLAGRMTTPRGGSFAAVFKRSP
jgi:hypothetical protein